jgi:hypothetical protein
MAFLLGHLQEVLNEVHDIGPSVHVSLCDLLVMRAMIVFPGGGRETNTLYLF